MFIHVLRHIQDCNYIYEFSWSCEHLYSYNFAAIITIEMFREFLMAKLEGYVWSCKVNNGKQAYK